MPKDQISENIIPFPSREMFEFGTTGSFQIRVDVQTHVAATFELSGATKENVFTYSFDTEDSTSIQTFTFGVSDIPVFLTIRDFSSPSRKGEVYISTHLVVNGDRLYQLAQGYLSFLSPLSWPVAQGPDQYPGKTVPVEEVISSPSAGDDFTETVPNNEFWILKAARFRLTTDSNAANRRAHLRIEYTAAQSYDFFNDIDQTASTTREYTCAAVGVLPDREDDNDIIIPIPPDLPLTEGTDIKSDVTNIQSGDQLSAVHLVVEKYFDTQ